MATKNAQSTTAKSTLIPGKFVWFELVSRDPKKAQAFYGEVLGWKVQAFPMGDFTYEMIETPTGTVGGYAPPRSDRAPSHWISYVSVADVDASLQAAVAAGGKVIEPAFDVPNVGRMARIADPTGAELCLYRSASGTDEADQPASQGRFFWNELLTTDTKTAVGFYTRLLGYEHKEMEMGPAGTYHVLEKDGVPRAGAMKLRDAGVAPSWLPYVAVDDCDAAVARAQRHGGKVLVPAEEIPGVGRFAVLADPTGATIAVIKPALKP